MEEIWKDLIYQGNNYGKFYQISNTCKIRNNKTKYIVKFHLLKAGYYGYCGSVGGRKNRKLFKLHRAIMETFVDNPNNYPVINHKDGNKLNNQLDNLEWCTQKYNSQHAFDIGLSKHKIGETNHLSKLKNNDVLFIKNNYIPYDKTYGTRALGKMFNIDHMTILRVIKNITWKHIK